MATLNDFRLRLGTDEYLPIMIGGMGVDISTADLALEACRLGGIGHMSDAMTPFVSDRKFKTHFTKTKSGRYKFNRDNVDKTLINAARTFGVKGPALYWTVILPAALPRIFAGARMSLGVGFMVIVGAEMIGTIQGLGALIMEARTFYRSDVTIVGMLIIGVIGFVISSGLMRIEKILIPWDTGLSQVRR